MSGKRWQHLDRRPSRTSRPDREATRTASGAAPTPAAEVAAPNPELGTALARARGYYHLRQYHACRETLELWLTESAGAETLRLAGLAAGHTGDFAVAAEWLARAWDLEPDDVTRAAGLSALLAAGGGAEVPISGDTGALGELAGAAAWGRGQVYLAEGRYVEAGRAFTEAANAFSASPPAAIGERAAATYVGLAVAQLLAGHWDAAQQAFSRLPARSAVGEPVLAFARKVYEIADALRDLEPGEREEVLAALAELVRRVRLRVGFYDGTIPVKIFWDNLG